MSISWCASDVHIGTVKFSNQFKESSCSPVVTFSSVGSEGHGVQPPQGDSFLSACVRIQFFFCTTFFCFNQVRDKRTFQESTTNLADRKKFPTYYVLM